MQYARCFVIPHSLSTLYRCSLTTVAQDKPYHEKPLIRDCYNHKGSCTLIRPYLIIAVGIRSSSFVRVSTRQLAVSSLSKGISSTLNFHDSIDTDGTRTRNLLPTKRASYRLSLLDCLSDGEMKTVFCKYVSLDCFLKTLPHFP